MNGREDNKCCLTVSRSILYLYEVCSDHHNEDIPGFKHSKQPQVSENSTDDNET